MEESKCEKGVDKNTFQILDTDESKFLDNARKQLYNMQNDKLDKPKAFNTKSSVQGKFIFNNGYIF